MSEPTGVEPVIDLAQLALPPAWMEDALCAQIDHDGFFPRKGQSSSAAVKACGLCPVRAKCLAYAIDNEEPHGVWGGLTANQRKPLVLAHRAAQPLVCALPECDELVDRSQAQRRFCSNTCAGRSASRRHEARKDLAS